MSIQASALGYYIGPTLESIQYETVARSPKEQVLLVFLWGFAECGNRKALRLKAQGVYSCK